MLYRKAANQGDFAAQYNLGMMYEKGLGVPQNLVLSYQWYAVSANRENEMAITALEQLKTQLSPEKIKEGERLVQQWTKKHTQ